MAEEYIKIDDNNYEVKDVVDKINIPKYKARKELLLKIRDIAEKEKIEIVNFERNQTAEKSYTQLIDGEISRIDKILGSCKG